MFEASDPAARAPQYGRGQGLLQRIEVVAGDHHLEEYSAT